VTPRALYPGCASSVHHPIHCKTKWDKINHRLWPLPLAGGLLLFSEAGNGPWRFH